MSAPGFLLGEATASEKLSRDRLTFEAWGARLSPEQYLERERLLRATEHARWSMHTWVLRLPNGVVVASCETFRLNLVPGGALEVVASVFVERPLRGVGMASRLTGALVAHRREAGIDGLVLFSEVGTEIYARAGFRVLPAPTRRIAASPGAMPLGSAERSFDSIRVLRAGLREGDLHLRVDRALFDWHHARSGFYARMLGLEPIDSVGATVDGVTGLWAADVKGGVLRLLDVSGERGASMDGLLELAARVAHRHGLSAVELWDDAHSLTLGGPPPFQRDDDLPMGVAFTPRGELALGPLSRAFWA
jgi:hypothetical protein